MNRLGENYDSFSKLEKIFKNENLNILGIYSHLCAADSIENKDIEFTKKQIKDFNECVFYIKNNLQKDINTHILSSYGIINYNEYKFDYVRPGIIMYGVHSVDFFYDKINLKPVLNLKAKITSIRKIKNNETVGYGRMYKTIKPKKIATVSIGYADGYPRILSFKDTKVKVKNKYVNIVGKICMDQLMIDVTNIEKVNVGDIVTLIDNDLISVENISKKADTITHELLSRLGSRLNRTIK